MKSMAGDIARRENQRWRRSGACGIAMAELEDSV